MITSRLHATGSVALLFVVLLAGCSSSAKNNGGGAPPPSESSTAPGSSPAAVSSSAAMSGTPADPATKAAVAAAYSAFFSSHTTQAQSRAALQHGSVFAATLAAEAKSSHAKNASAEVTAVTVSGNVANVTFTLLSGGSPILPNTNGYAVREGGKWKVAAQTFCVLLNLEGTAPPACKDPAVTALPH